MLVSVLLPFLPTGPQVPPGLVGPAGPTVSEPWDQAPPHLGQGTALGLELRHSGRGPSKLPRDQQGVLAHEAPRGPRPPAPPGGLSRRLAVPSAAPFHRHEDEAQKGAVREPRPHRKAAHRLRPSRALPLSLLLPPERSYFKGKKSRDFMGHLLPHSPRGRSQDPERGQVSAPREGQDGTHLGGQAGPGSCAARGAGWFPLALR